MADVVHIPQNIEVLPADQMVKFTEALATMETLRAELDAIHVEARQLLEFKTWTPEQRVRAGELTTDYKNKVKTGESTIQPFKDAVNEFKKKYILTPENRVNNKAEEIKMGLSPRMGEWDREDERQKEIEKKRIADAERAKLERAAEVKRQEDEALAKQAREKRVSEIRQDLKDKKITKREAEKLLREAGALEEALKAKAAADQEEGKQNAKKIADSVKVGPRVGPIAGNVKRVNWSAQCTDKRGFIMAMIEFHKKKEIQAFERLLAMLEVSDQKLSGEARDKVKTSMDDKDHELTVAQFEALYPYVTAKENRSF